MQQPIPGDDCLPPSIMNMESQANRSRSDMDIPLWDVTARAIFDRSCTTCALPDISSDARSTTDDDSSTMAPHHSPSQHGRHAALLNCTASSTIVGHHRHRVNLANAVRKTPFSAGWFYILVEGRGNEFSSVEIPPRLSSRPPLHYHPTLPTRPH